MTLSQFVELLNRFGPVVDRWPPALLNRALDFLQSSTRAQDAFVDACSV